MMADLRFVVNASGNSLFSFQLKVLFEQKVHFKLTLFHLFFFSIFSGMNLIHSIWFIDACKERCSVAREGMK